MYEYDSFVEWYIQDARKILRARKHFLEIMERDNAGCGDDCLDLANVYYAMHPVPKYSEINNS